MWRWDQGRLAYFDFEILKRIAKSLVQFDNKNISECEELFRRTFFADYNSQDERIYPFCAMIKFLIAKKESGKAARLSLEEIFDYIAATQSTGRENLDYYKQLEPGNCHFTDTDRRQLREMVIFISQCNILKYRDGFLYLEDLNFNDENALISNFLNPPQRSTKADRAEEFREMTSPVAAFFKCGNIFSRYFSDRHCRFMSFLSSSGAHVL